MKIKIDYPFYNYISDDFDDLIQSSKIEIYFNSKETFKKIQQKYLSNNKIKNKLNYNLLLNNILSNNIIGGKIEIGNKILYYSNDNLINKDFFSKKDIKLFNKEIEKVKEIYYHISKEPSFVYITNAIYIISKGIFLDIDVFENNKIKNIKKSVFINKILINSLEGKKIILK